MQFHLNGFRPGDPNLAPAAGTPPDFTVLPDTVDVLIVGCGPAGLTLAAQLAAFPGIITRIVEQKDGPLQLGQADGIACRSMEMFQAFGFAHEVLKESYWVNETVFWKPDPANPAAIIRHGRIQDVEDGLSEMPHVILSQARIHDMYLDVMRRSPTRLEPTYSRRLLDLAVDDAAAQDPSKHAVTARIERIGPDHAGTIETVRARYVVGCDGARSAVRKAIGRQLEGDSANRAWGVMDVLAVTNFPDVRIKSVIQSAGEGSILIIPREGGYLFRIYVELDKLAPHERVASRNITVDHLIAAANRILHPHRLEVREVAWWSVYEIGQRLTNRFDDAPDDAGRQPRVFIAGDACHTHSPKAGQGMNVSMQDGFNLGWKLAAVLNGRSPPTLLKTYSEERQAIAKELIEFDRELSLMLSAPQKQTPDGEGVTPQEVQDYFVRHGRYTAGTATRYAPSTLTSDGAHLHLATGFIIGMRFHSAPVVRLADAKPLELGHVAAADGRWRLYIFADDTDPFLPQSRLRGLCDFLAGGGKSPIRRHKRTDDDIDAVIDVRAVFQQGHHDLALQAMPPFLLPAKGRLGLQDYEKAFCADARVGRDIFDLRGIARAQGCMVIVRPDQYVANVLPIDDHEGLTAFFQPILLTMPCGS